MAEQARVSSLDALEAFRSSLIIFLDHAHRSVDDVGDEVRRMRGWLMNDRRPYWEAQIRKRRNTLGAAQQELLSAKLSNLRDNISAQENAVRKAKEAVDLAEKKLRAVKGWIRNYDNAVDPHLKRIDGLRNVLDYDLPKGLSFLVQAQRTLEAYADVKTTLSGPRAATESAQPPEAISE